MSVVALELARRPIFVLLPLLPNFFVCNRLCHKMKAMSSGLNITAVDDGPRYSNAGAQKISGATYTSFGLATFVAQQMC
jgi:hypothetical protein